MFKEVIDGGQIRGRQSAPSLLLVLGVGLAVGVLPGSAFAAMDLPSVSFFSWPFFAVEIASRKGFSRTDIMLSASRIALGLTVRHLSSSSTCPCPR